MELNEKLVEVRKATRLLAAYYRRLITIVELLQAHLEQAPRTRLRFVRWMPTHTRPIGRQTSPLPGRWGWDFLPLNDAWMAWTTDGADRPGRVGSAFVGLRHVTDTGYRYDGEQPDPTRFAPAAEACSELHVWAVALGAGRCAATWDEVEAALEAAVDDDDALDGHVRQLALPLEGASDEAVFRAVGTSVDVALLATEEDVRRELIGRVSELIDAVLAHA